MSLPCLNPPMASYYTCNTNKTSLPWPSRPHVTCPPTTSPGFFLSYDPIYTLCSTNTYFLCPTHEAYSSFRFSALASPLACRDYPLLSATRLLCGMFTVQDQAEQRVSFSNSYTIALIWASGSPASLERFIHY